MFRQKYLILQILFVFACLQTNAQVKYFKMPSHIADSDYLAKTIIFKIKPEFRAFCKENVIDIPNLKNAFTSIGANNVLKKFPGKKPPVTDRNKFGEKMEDLSMIYELKYTANIALEKAINQLLASGLLEYAEPHYLPHLFNAYNPNDPMADTTNSQFSEWQLKTIKAYDAWGIQKGDTNIVIGITDTGTEVFHPDLYGSIKINYADPINGIDDDGDGFVDNYYGWDLGCNDSMPQWEVYGHGVHVSGLCSGTVNNGIGVAGVGFKCKYLPVKISDHSGVLTMAYEGIVYAADHGCSIINCSWGGYGGAGQYGQSIINYATFNNNALVVAACGNDDVNYPIYPAAYDNVMSVAATDISDHKWVDNSNGTGSNWGTTIDIAAPGANVTSTWINGGYVSSTGTSMAAPIVSGAAAIVKAQNPLYSATQIAAQLKASADNIYTIPFNAPYTGLLGAGRLNMFKALVSNSPWIEMISNSITDNNDETFVDGDTLVISGVFKNYLAQSNSNLSVKISTSCPYINILKSNALIGSINTLGTKSVANAFKARILAGAYPSTQVDFKLTFKDTIANYTSTQYFSVIINVDYMNIDTNKVATTMTSKGKIGYNEAGSYLQGIGFTYNNSASYLNQCGGFIVGNSTARVSDNLYGSQVGSYDDDFGTSKVVHRVKPPAISDFEAECVFNDSLAGTNMMSLMVTNKAYAWNSAPRDKFIIMEYTIKNKGTSTFSTLYAGLFMDFDMGIDGTKDQINYDATNRMGYTYSLQGGTYAAIKLLSNGIVHHYAFDKDGAFNGNATSIDINDGFNSYEKYSALKTNTFDHHDVAGIPNGNDVADMISSGPFILQPGDSVVVSFALIAGDHLADIQASAIAADQIYNHAGISENDLSNAIQLSDVFPNPANGSITVNVHLPAASVIDLSLYDRSGQRLCIIKSGKVTQGDHQFAIPDVKYSAGIYFLRLKCGDTVISKDVTIVK